MAYWYISYQVRLQDNPEPKINDYDSTYFRIIKGGIHTNRFHVATPDRWNVLIKQGIDAEFKGWRDSGDYVLLCPSSPMVTHHINGITQDEWRTQVTKQLEEVCKRPVLFRNKPRPVNEWYRY